MSFPCNSSAFTIKAFQAIGSPDNTDYRNFVAYITDGTKAPYVPDIVTLQEAGASGDRALVMTREFNAPKTMLFQAWTKPELLKRWLAGPEGWTMTVCESSAGSFFPVF